MNKLEPQSNTKTLPVKFFFESVHNIEIPISEI